MKKGLLMMLPLALILVFTACNKDQKAVKTLDGSWNLVIQDGEAVTGDDVITYDFDNCKLKSEEFCDLTITDADGTETTSYAVEDDGETLVLVEQFDGASIEFEAKIIELTESTLIFDIEFIGTTRLEFKKN